MLKITKNDSLQRFTSCIIAAALLLIVLPAPAGAAMGQDPPSASQSLTLKDAVNLALKQNLDLQIANIETAIQQQGHVIARSELIPHAGFVANYEVTRYDTKAELGVQPSIIPHDVGPYQAMHIGPTLFTPIFDLTLIRQYQESGHRLQANRADEQTVSEETVLLAVGDYMAHLRALASITAGMAKGRKSGAASALFNMMRNSARMISGI